MDNPYQAPTVNVDNGIIEPRSKKGWKIFAWFLLAMQLLLVFLVMLAGEDSFVDEMSVWDHVSTLLIYPAIIVGVFAFAYDWKLLNPVVWKLVLVVGLLGDFYSYTVAASEWEYEDMSMLGPIWYAMMALIFFLFLMMTFFQYFALYQYGFKSPDIWLPEDKIES